MSNGSANFIPDMFMKYPGAEGECQIKDKKDQIAVLNYDFSVQAVSTLNQGSGQKGGRGTMSPIYLEMVHDKGFPKLRKFSAQGTETDNVIISRTADGKDDEVITLTGSKVVSASSAHRAGGNNTASVVLTFKSAKVETYSEVNNAFVVSDSTTYDLAEGSAE